MGTYFENRFQSRAVFIGQAKDVAEPSIKVCNLFFKMCVIIPEILHMNKNRECISFLCGLTQCTLVIYQLFSGKKLHSIFLLF